MDQFWPDLQLPKAKIKMPWATAECDKIPKMGKIICFYVNTHVLKSEPGYFVTISHRYCSAIFALGLPTRIPQQTWSGADIW